MVSGGETRPVPTSEYVGERGVQRSGWQDRAARVLVVEDDPSIRSFLREVLAEEGYAVHTAADGAEALALVQDARARQPDVILLDTLMPRLDGWGFLRAYRALPLRHAAVISMGFGGPLERSDDAPEADSYLKKPFDLEQLLALIARHAGVTVP